MQYASKILRTEHEDILLGLQILEHITTRINQQDHITIQDISDLVTYVRLFADRCHHGKEEDIMFPAMERHGIPNQGGPIGQMLIEHDQGRNYIASMKAAISDGQLAAKQFSAAATAYIHLMRAHIEKENEVLFMMGDRMMPQTVQQQLIQEFNDFEAQVIGKDTHDQLQKTLLKLKKIYLT